MKKQKKSRYRYLKQNKAEVEANCEGIAQANSRNSKHYCILERKDNEPESIRSETPFLYVYPNTCAWKQNQSAQLYQAPRYVGKDREKRSKKRPCVALVLFKHIPGDIQRRFGVITRSPR